MLFECYDVHNFIELQATFIASDLLTFKESEFSSVLTVEPGKTHLKWK